MKNILKTVATILLALCAILALASCGKAYGSADTYYPTEDKFENGAPAGTVTEDSFSADRKIIKTVNESIQTENFDDFISELRTSVTELGGYISSANLSGDNYYNTSRMRSASFVIKIPADKLDQFSGEVDSLGMVYSYSESVKDVTASYVDVASRISVLRAEESALIEMLTCADSITATLEIRTRLNTVQSEIASLEAQKRTYDSLIAYSTVNLNVYEVRREQAVNPTFSEEVNGKFVDSIRSIGEGARAFVVWVLGNILYIIIYAALATGAVFGLIKLSRFVRKRRTKNADEKPENVDQ